MVSISDLYMLIRKSLLLNYVHICVSILSLCNVRFLFTTHTLTNLLIITLKLRPGLLNKISIQALPYMDNKFYVSPLPVPSTYNVKILNS